MRYNNQSLDRSEERPKGIWNFGMILLCMYIMLNYIAQETLVTPMYHTLVLYGFLGWTLISVLRQGRIRLTNFTIWQLAMLIISMISALWAEIIVDTALNNMIIGVVLSFCFIQTLDTQDRLETCLLTFVIAADLLGVLLIVTGQMTGEETRLGETVTGNANSFSALIMVAAIFAAWFAVYKKDRLRYLGFGSLAFCIYMMALSGGRKTIVAVVVCIVYYILSKDNTKNRKVLSNIAKAMLAIAAVYYFIMNNPVLYDAIGERIEGMIDLISGGESSVGSDAIRQELVRIGLDKWLENPIFGYGVDTFKYYNWRVTGHFYYAHNNFVELLYDLGLIGFLAYYYFYVRMVRQFRAVPQEFSAYRSLGIGTILCMLIYDVGGISYYTVFIQYILAIVYSVILVFPKTNTGETQ